MLFRSTVSLARIIAVISPGGICEGTRMHPSLHLLEGRNENDWFTDSTNEIEGQAGSRLLNCVGESDIRIVKEIVKTVGIVVK